MIRTQPLYHSNRKISISLRAKKRPYPPSSFEGFSALELEQLLLMQDEIEQENEINAIEKSLKEEQEEINQEQLTEIQLWDHADFVVQQLNQN